MDSIPRVESISGRLVSLRPISREDYTTLFRWRSSLGTVHLLNFRRRIAPFEEAVREFETIATNGILMLVVDRASQRRIGYAASPNLNPWDGWANVGMYVEPEFRYRGHGGEAALLAVDTFFRLYPVKKLVTEIYEFAQPLIKMAQAMGFEEVGFAADHYWYGDRWWGVHYMVLKREAWLLARERFSDVVSVQTAFHELESAKRAYDR